MEVERCRGVTDPVGKRGGNKKQGRKKRKREKEGEQKRGGEG